MYAYLPGVKEQSRRRASSAPASAKPSGGRRPLSIGTLVKAASHGLTSTRDRRGRRQPVFVQSDNEPRIRWKSNMEAKLNQYELPKPKR